MRNDASAGHALASGQVRATRQPGLPGPAWPHLGCRHRHHRQAVDGLVLRQRRVQRQADQLGARERRQRRGQGRLLGELLSTPEATAAECRSRTSMSGRATAPASTAAHAGRTWNAMLLAARCVHTNRTFSPAGSAAAAPCTSNRPYSTSGPTQQLVWPYLPNVTPARTTSARTQGQCRRCRPQARFRGGAGRTWSPGAGWRRPGRSCGPQTRPACRSTAPGPAS